MSISRALIVRAPYAGMIVDGLKTWEMRSRHVSKKMLGRIGIIEGGSGTIIGEVDLTASLSYADNLPYLKTKHYMHCVEDCELLKRWPVAWLLNNAERYAVPVPYVHPRGCVTWVRI